MTAIAFPTMSPRDRRAIVIGGTTLLAALIVLRVFPAWRQRLHADQQHAAALIDSVARARNIVALAGGSAQATHLIERQYLSLAPALLDGDTPAQASATLAAYISETAAATGVRLGTVQLTVDTSASRNELYHIRLRVDGTGDIRGITAWLATLERGGDPLLAVRTLSISQADPAAPANRPETLRAALDVEGLARRDTD